MATIQKRTVFHEKRPEGVYRFHDWALVTTPIGVCAEPFIVNNRFGLKDFSAYDPEDEMSRIDAIKSIDMDKEKLILSGGKHVLHGGYTMPRNGR